MEFLRKAAKTWVAKLLLLLLVASFGVWGISGSLLSGQSNTVVTVGEQQVSPTEFLLTYQQQTNLYSQQFGRRLTSEEARILGVEQQVFSQLTTNATLDQQAEDLDLGVSDAREDKIIMSSPLFQDRVTGQFSKAAFTSTLRNLGLSEKQFLEISSKTAKREQIVEAIVDGYQTPQVMVQALADYNAEKRDIDYLVIKPELLGDIADPTDEKLATFFDEKKSDYSAPEFRKIVYVKLQPEDILDLDGVSEEAILEEYEARKSSFSTEEQRTIDQLTFADKATADAALEKLKSGTSFDEIVKAEGKTASDVAIGTYSKARVPDQNLAEAVFGVTEAGGTTDVLDGTFGPVIVRVSEIVVGETKTFDDVKDQIRENLALIAASEALFDVHDAYEDDRGSGLTLIEAADKQNLDYVTLEMVDQFGLDENGAQIKDIPQQNELLSQAFDSDVNLDAPAISMGNNGFVWFEVLDILPARDRTLDEVKDKVIADWTAEETKRLLSEKANELKERLDQGETLFALGDEFGVSPEKKIEVTRRDADDTFGTVALSTAFSGPEGLSAVTNDASGDNKILMKVVAINIPEDAASAPDLEQTVNSINRDISNEIATQLVRHLQAEYGVSINRDLATRIVANSF